MTEKDRRQLLKMREALVAYGKAALPTRYLVGRFVFCIMPWIPAIVGGTIGFKPTFCALDCIGSGPGGAMMPKKSETVDVVRDLVALVDARLTEE